MLAPNSSQRHLIVRGGPPKEPNEPEPVSPQPDSPAATGRRIVGGLPLHPAADFYYHRNDLLTAERLGRFSLVASAIAAFVATFQFMTRLRRRVARRRRTDADADASELANTEPAIAGRASAEPTSEEPLEKRVEL